MCQCGVFTRRKFPARSAFAPQVLNFFFVRSRLLCAIARWARTLQRCELFNNFFIQLLYGLAIPRMRIPPFLKDAETRYFISKLSCQRRLLLLHDAINPEVLVDNSIRERTEQSYRQTPSSRFQVLRLERSGADENCWAPGCQRDGFAQPPTELHRRQGR